MRFQVLRVHEGKVEPLSIGKLPPEHRIRLGKASFHGGKRDLTRHRVKESKGYARRVAAIAVARYLVQQYNEAEPVEWIVWLRHFEDVGSGLDAAFADAL